MNKIKITILITLFSLIVCGCSKKEDTMPPHLVAVPKNAALVIAVNSQQIVEKAGLNKFEQFKMFSLIQQEIENQPAEMRKFIKDFLKDTRVSGLNLDKVFMYICGSENGNEPVVGFTFLMDNVKKFEELLKKSDMMIWMDEDRKIFNPNGNITIQWNDKIAAIVMDAGKINILNNDENESILANQTFKNAYDSEKDVWMYFDFNGLVGTFENTMETTEFAALELYKDFKFIMSINSEKGNLVADLKIFPEDKATELYGKYYKENFDSELYKYFPDKSLATYKMSIKPLEAYNEYKKTIGIGVSAKPTETTTEDVEILDDNGKVVDVETVDVDNYDYAPNYNYNYQMKLMIEQYDAKITSVLSCFTGDVLASLLDYENIFAPEIALAAGIAEGKESDVIAIMNEIGFKKNQDEYYSLQEGMPIHFAVKKNIAYFALSTDAIQKFLANGYTSNITSAKDFGSDLKNANMYFYWNININDYPAFFKTMLNGSNEGRMFMPLLETLKSLTAKNIGTAGGELRIKFNENDYATRIILKQIDELVSQYLNVSM
jgi:hypothetical protein